MRTTVLVTAILGAGYFVQAEAQREDEAQLAPEQEQLLQESNVETVIEGSVRYADDFRLIEEPALRYQYLQLILISIEQNWIRPASARAGLKCELYITQLASGDIVDVRTGRCSGDLAVVRSIEVAALRSSPLPTPLDPSLFERDLKLVFAPDM